MTVQSSGPSYAAPALEKGLDILELLCRSSSSLSQIEIAEALGRSVSEIYRMLSCLVSRDYVVNIAESYAITPKLFTLAHSNPLTNRLLTEAGPVMHELSSDLQQACHLTIYDQGRQVVIAKVDSPGSLGFSVRVGAELPALISASGRVLIAFQDSETVDLRIKESIQRLPSSKSIDIEPILEAIRVRGFESMVSLQIKGLYAVSYPVLDSRNHALAAVTVPYAERLDQTGRATILDVEVALGKAARVLSERMGWREEGSLAPRIGSRPSVEANDSRRQSRSTSRSRKH